MRLFAAAALAARLVQGQAGPPETHAEPPAAAVTLDGEALFRVRGVEAYPAEQRARVISERIEAVAADRSIPVSALRIAEVENHTTISAGHKLLMAVTEADAHVEGVERKVLVPLYSSRIAKGIESYRDSRSLQNLSSGALKALAATLGLGFILFAISRAFRRLLIASERAFREKFQDHGSPGREIVHEDRLWATIGNSLRVIRAAIYLLIGFLYLEFVLSLFPWTKATAARLLEIILGPPRTMGKAFVTALPDLLFVAVLIVVVRYVLKFTRFLFDAIESGSIQFVGFDPDWAKPTYQLARVLIVAFGAIIAYPYLPGSGSDAFKGVSLFLGLVFSLSSSTAIANAIAGYTLTYRRAFRVGDRVKIGEAYGDVTEFRMQATYLRSLKNEEIVVPNSEILKSQVINYSTLAKPLGLILHTEVGIGYETPWRQVEAMLLEAAQRTPGLLREPAPFMRQKVLGDFAITYEINAYCDQPQAASALYTALHRNILDIFNEYGVQIMTPSYVADPAVPKVVPRDQQFVRLSDPAAASVSPQ